MKDLVTKLESLVTEAQFILDEAKADVPVHVTTADDPTWDAVKAALEANGWAQNNPTTVSEPDPNVA